MLTVTAKGEMTMDNFLRKVQDPAERKATFDALAREIRKMHDAGLASPDLFTRYIFFGRGPSPQFGLIDMARMDRRETLPESLRARDLAALHVTAPSGFMSEPEHHVFFKFTERHRNCGT